MSVNVKHASSMVSIVTSVNDALLCDVKVFFVFVVFLSVHAGLFRDINCSQRSLIAVGFS